MTVIGSSYADAASTNAPTSSSAKPVDAAATKSPWPPAGMAFHMTRRLTGTAMAARMRCKSSLSAAWAANGNRLTSRGRARQWIRHSVESPAAHRSSRAVPTFGGLSWPLAWFMDWLTLGRTLVPSEIDML